MRLKRTYHIDFLSKLQNVCIFNFFHLPCNLSLLRRGLHEVSIEGKVSAQGVMELPITPRALTFIQETSCKLFVNTLGGSAEERASSQIPFSYPEPFLRAVRRGALAKSKTGNHKNMVKDIYVIRTITFVVANQMPV